MTQTTWPGESNKFLYAFLPRISCNGRVARAGSKVPVPLLRFIFYPKTIDPAYVRIYWYDTCGEYCEGTH